MAPTGFYSSRNVHFFFAMNHSVQKYHQYTNFFSNVSKVAMELSLRLKQSYTKWKVHFDQATKHWIPTEVHGGRSFGSKTSPTPQPLTSMLTIGMSCNFANLTFFKRKWGRGFSKCFQRHHTCSVVFWFYYVDVINVLTEIYRILAAAVGICAFFPSIALLDFRMDCHSLLFLMFPTRKPPNYLL